MSPPTADPAALPVLSYNVRCDTPEDGDDAWPHRRDRVARVLERRRPAVIGLQEVLPHQFAYLRERLDGYRWLGVGRVDGGSEGEHVPLGVRRDAAAVEDWGMVWLSETPGEPSVGWDAACPRIATWATLSLARDGPDLTVANTHLDHAGERARERGVGVILDDLGLADRAPALLLGDCNCEPGDPPYRRVVEAGLADLRTSAETVVGPAETFHRFTGRPTERLDYLFGSGVSAERFETVVPDGEGHASDHYPVCARVRVGGD